MNNFLVESVKEVSAPFLGFVQSLSDWTLRTKEIDRPDDEDIMSLKRMENIYNSWTIYNQIKNIRGRQKSKS